MIQPLAHYARLLEAGKLLDSLKVPVLVWIAPPPSKEKADLTRTRDLAGIVNPPAKPVGDAVAIELVSAQGKALTLGRSSTCHILVDDESVSRRHLELAPSGQGWNATDLGSMNGTWVGAVKLAPATPTPIADGARLQVGNVETFFMLPESFRVYLQQKRK